MDVYLTFDDGIQAGTEEVLDVLKATGVKGTFFLIGNELQNSYKRNQVKLLDLLHRINTYHDIGMHSYSHTNFNYAAYYKNNGVQIDRDGTMRSIVNDFKKGEALIAEFLGDAWIVFPKNKRANLARLPGRNSFCVSRQPAMEQHDFSKSFCRFQKGTERCSRELYEAGYNIYGWNVEWEMSFELHKVALEQKQLKETTTGINYMINEDFYPDLDMYSPEHIDKDRLTEDWTSVFNKIMATIGQQGMAILLMHDRAFRKGGKDKVGNFDPYNNDAANKLHSLIVQLKNRQVCFKGLQNL